MKIAVIYWSGTGNTEAMASAVAEGAGAELYSVSQFSGDVSEYDRLAFGCPAMGAENLEEGEFEPRCSVPMAGATANGCASGLSASGMTAQLSLMTRV